MENQRWENDCQGPLEMGGDEFYSQTLEQGVQAALGRLSEQSLPSSASGDIPWLTW